VTTVIRKWGNSLGVRIPKRLADELGMSAGASVTVTADKRRIVIAPAAPVYELARLLKGVNARNRHQEFDTGSARGAEVW
jgi:antitoxin MazE